MNCFTRFCQIKTLNYAADQEKYSFCQLMSGYIIALYRLGVMMHTISIFLVFFIHSIVVKDYGGALIIIPPAS